MNFQKRFDFPQIRYELASGYFPLDEKHTLHKQPVECCANIQTDKHPNGISEYLFSVYT